jgi:hypothetical protein
MKLVLHVGIHKTGTSAIQAFCKANRAALIEKGILYPNTALTELSVTSTPTSQAGHRAFQDVLVTPVNQNSEAMLSQIAEEANAFDNIHTVLISCETFSAPRVKISTSVPESLQRYFSETSILMYLRRQDDWAASFYKEVLCWPGRKSSNSFNQFIKGFLAEWLDFQNRVNNWADVFGDEKLIVKSYDDRLNKNIIIDFFAQLGLDVTDQQQFRFPGFNNPSLPDDLVELMRGINRYKMNREQRSKITNRIFNELSASRYEVDYKPVLTPAIRRSMAKKFSGMNRALADRFNIEPSEKLCNFGEIRQIETEISLTRDQVRDIERMAEEIDQQNRELNRLAKKRKDQGRVGVSCLLNEAPLQTKFFVYYHLALGVSRIRLYFDNPEDPMLDHDFGTDRVEVVPCSDDFWHQLLGRMPKNNAEKLSSCHKQGLNDLNKMDDIDWVINLDADELLYVKPGATLADYLPSVLPQHLQVQARPLEAIFVNEADSQLFAARYFKVPRIKLDQRRRPGGRRVPMRLYLHVLPVLEWLCDLSLVRRALVMWSNTAGIFLSWSKTDEKLYKRHMPQLANIMREGYLAHRMGRIFSRHGIEFDHVTSHKPEFSGRKPRILYTNNTVFVLHYDAADFDAWYLKWHRRIYGDTTVSAIGDKRRMQQDLFRDACERGDDAVRALFNDFFMFPQAAITRFERAGLVVKLDLPLIEQVRQQIEAQ